MKTALIACIACVALTNLCAADRKAEKPAWRASSELDQAYADASHLGRPVVVMIFDPATTCPISRGQAGAARSLPSLAGFECVEAPPSSPLMIKLMEQARMHTISIPTLFLLKGDGTLIDQVQGEKVSADGERMLQAALATLGPNPGKEAMAALWGDLERARDLLKSGDSAKALKLYAKFAKVRKANPDLQLVAEFEKDIPDIDASGAREIEQALKMIAEGKANAGRQELARVKRTYVGFHPADQADAALREAKAK